MSDSKTKRDDPARPSLLASALVGAMAYAAVYLATYGVVLVVGLKRQLLGADGSTLRAAADLGQAPNDVGVLLYNAHLVDLSIGYLSVDALGALAGQEPLLTVVWAFPPVALLVAGALLGRGIPDGASAGARLTLGYLPVAVGGLLTFSVEVRQGLRVTTASPDLLTGFIFAGLLYPLLFGALGGWLASR